MESDCDNDDERCTIGTIPGFLLNRRDVMRNYENEMPLGEQGGLIFIEVIRDSDADPPTA
ncbi:MAG: hypothetical protein LC734_10050 [Acidobacteria bacterium]|nr:hypothetical protein [Acidobacteriota bacterium]